MEKSGSTKIYPFLNTPRQEFSNQCSKSVVVTGAEWGNKMGKFTNHYNISGFISVVAAQVTEQ